MGNIIAKDGKVYLRIIERGMEEWYYYDTAMPPIGGGAMGTVYLGRSVRDQHALVAIKQVAPAIAAIPSARQRARVEASLAFSHPNMVEMKGCCEDHPDHGPMFIISKYVQGITIDKFAQAFDNHPQRATKICNMMLPVLDALEYLHNKGVVHMDVKPSNIMIEGNSVVKLMDLGISYSPSMIALSGVGMLGTPGYAAPEQNIVNGQPQGSLNASTDIYAMGATLYELISGNKPYAGGGDTLEPIPGVPAPLMRVIAKALQKHQTMRYASAADFKQDLQAAMHAPDRAAPLPLAKAAIIGGAALLVLIILLLILL